MILENQLEKIKRETALTKTKTDEFEYYTVANIDAKSSDYLDELEAIIRPRAIIEEKIALIVIDMQNYFLDPESHAFVPSAKPILPRIKYLQDLFLEKDRPVFQTRHVNDESNAGTMLQWWTDLIEEGPMAEIYDGLKDERVDIIPKAQYDAFLDTELETKLKDMRISQLAITGVTTHLCCETTARSAFMRGFEVFLVVDGVATFAESFHRASIINLTHGFAVPTLSSKIGQALGDKK